MGYYLLGVIIFLLVLVFVNDLYKQSKEKRSSEAFYRKFEYRHEFAEDEYQKVNTNLSYMNYNQTENMAHHGMYYSDLENIEEIEKKRNKLNR